jgi:hypothetical protein
MRNTTISRATPNDARRWPEQPRLPTGRICRGLRSSSTSMTRPARAARPSCIGSRSPRNRSRRGKRHPECQQIAGAFPCVFRRGALGADRYRGHCSHINKTKALDPRVRRLRGQSSISIHNQFAVIDRPLKNCSYRSQFAVANGFGCSPLGAEICFPAHEVVCANSAYIIVTNEF